MTLRVRLEAMSRNSFIRSAGVLVGGTALSQALAVLALPVLTRLYTPEDFNLLAVYVALLTIISVVACLRLEIAIPLPKDDAEAANLLGAALATAGLGALLIGVALLFGGNWFFRVIRNPEMQPHAWLLPFGVWLSGTYSAMQFWATRRRWFALIARTRLVQAGSGLTAQAGLGWIGAGPIGLMLGHALLSGAGASRLALKAWRSERPIFSDITLCGMIAAVRNYRRFPLYSTIEALANNAAAQVPVILIASMAAGPEAGFVLLATQATGAPAAMIGNATGQVYLSHAPEELRAGRLGPFTAKVLHGLAVIGVVPIILFAFLAEPIFAFVFGEEWRRAGELVVWMTPWFVLKLLSSPVSMVMHVKMRQQAMLAVTVFGLVIRVSAVLAANALQSDLIAESYSIASAIFYLLLLIVISIIAEVSKRTLWIMAGYTVLSALPIILHLGMKL